MMRIALRSLPLLAVAMLLAAPLLAAEYLTVSPEELKALVDSDMRTFLLVDARNPEEYREAHIPGAINIPAKKFDHFSNLLPADKGALLIFYCNGVKCGKSKKAASKAMDLGYTNVKVFTEGMPVWEERGYSFYKGGDYEKPIETRKLAPQALQDLINKEPANIQVVDVRDPEEFAEGHIPGAINCPLPTFASRSGMLEKDKMVVVYCNAGGRSQSAYRKLVKLGYSNIAQALFADWKEEGRPVSR